MAPWTLSRLERAVESFSAQLQCAICLCAYDRPVSLPCNHCFCEECIHRALELKAACPICKAPAKKRRLRDDTTVQELLRATDMLCAAPDAAAEQKQQEEQHKEAPVKTEKTPVPAAPVIVLHADESEDSEPPKQVKSEQTQVKKAVPAARAKAAAVTPERRSSPRRAAAKRLYNSQTKSPSTQTLMDAWVSGASSQPRNGLKIKTEKPPTPVATPVRRTSPRRTLANELNAHASPLSPVLFEIAAPRVASAQAVGRTNGTEITEEVEERTSRRRRSRTEDVDSNGDAEETQLEPMGLKEQVGRNAWRRRSANDVVDVVVCETQLEEGEPDEQQTPPRRRRSATDLLPDQTQLEDAESQHTPILDLRSRPQSDSDESMEASDTQVEAVEPNHQTPTPRKRRRSATNGVATSATTDNTPNEAAVHQPIALSNGLAEASSLAVDSQILPPPDVEVFQIGDLVDVIERQWVGINKRGGAGRITKVHGDGYYAVRFVIGPGTDNRVPGAYIRRPAEDIVSDSTPSRAVRKRQRRRPSDVMLSPDLLTAKVRPSPRSSAKKKAKTKTKPKVQERNSGMVFLCSGFKESRMEQIDEWADLLGAEVVQYWSNRVTHLIVKCVNGDDMEGEAPSMDDSDSASSPQGHKNGKRKLFSGPKSGRWVKIRSLKYLKALVGGRWIVSEEWLQACADHGGYVSEVNYEADGHWKGRRIHDAVKRSRLTREKLLQLSAPDVDRAIVGTMLFADFCFHVIGEFLPPMPPITELNTLICMGGGKLIAFMDEIPGEMHKRENSTRKLIIVSDKINPIALRQLTRQLKAQPQVNAVSSAVIVNYLWVINSISEAKLRELP
ncbi:hypothetical protein PR003_g5503 [Phytophthora rubi]|uniref:RING-type E3 ubiquitin transferase BRCA1 n=1 Tax=Phytophthora rubi TaxID=129364 RepID=A0A6A4FJB7_9STRA|nr:hypothetical protein PR003_g5503 [Phytophthora rubi]